MNGLPEKANLESCGCCDANPSRPAIYNPPGLPAVGYRIGTHPEFLRRLIVRLPMWTIPNGEHFRQRPLEELTTRSTDDPMIALLDAWALVGDVLTFYQERIANEGFLRTATERLSVLELARAIGYELDPGVAASTYLVFTVENAVPLSNSAIVPAGTQVQSIPMGGGELPQTFETTLELEARVAWNAIKPRMIEPQQIDSDTTELYLRGVDLRLKTGDGIVIVGEQRSKIDPGSERWDFRLITAFETFPAQGYTRVTLDQSLGSDTPPGEPAKDEIEVYVFRERASLFGHNAPDWKVIPDKIRENYGNGSNWEGFDLDNEASNQTIYLDRVYSEFAPGGWVVLSQPANIRSSESANVELYKTVHVRTSSQTNFTLTAKTTQLELDTNEHLRHFRRRDTTVHAHSEQLKLAGAPINTRVGKSAQIELQGIVEGLHHDKVIVISGRETNDKDAETISEVARIESVAIVDLGDESYTNVTLQSVLSRTYERSTVNIYANVVLVTHGETVPREVLGSGDGSLRFQKYNLKKPPLTFVSTPSGSESTLRVRVDRVEWAQLSSLFRVGPDSRSYALRIHDNAQPTVLFGDGQDGARLPTGQENIVATYRSGIGSSGNVSAHSLTLLKTKPFGVRSVTNPREASGGVDPESLADARQNAPVTVLTFQRVVSLRDYEDFARSFPGIGKAHADVVSTGETEIVHVTIATPDGKAVGEPLFGNLFNAIASRRDPLQPFRLGNFEERQFNIDARVLIDPSSDWKDVQREISQTLRSAFAFDARAFAQPVSAAEVIQVMHSVTGVVAVDLNELLLTADTSAASPHTSLATVLQAQRTRFDGGKILAAEILRVNDTGILLREMKP